MKLSDIVKRMKTYRGFNVDSYIEQKTALINKFFKDNNLDSCVIGMSGGVDSATVLCLFDRASKQPGSPFRCIYPLILPIHGDGTTGQAEAQRLAELQCKALDRGYRVVDLTPVYKAYLRPFASSWANGQMASTIRMPAFYYHAALIQSEGYRSIVVGTTNRDEGSYVGYYGKTSDAMVDLQPIADIHKSEVYQVAEKLGVIEEIRKRPPTGDIWSGETTEVTMGAPYWFLEMYLNCLEEGMSSKLFLENSEELDLYHRYQESIEKLHTKNAHKYKVGMPSYFIDCMPRRIPNGW